VKSIITTIILTMVLSINVNAMSLNDQAICGILFSTVSSSNRQQGNIKMENVWRQKMLDMMNNMRKYGYEDDTITKAIGDNMPKALNILKSLEYNKAEYKKFINKCLDEIEK